MDSFGILDGARSPEASARTNIERMPSPIMVEEVQYVCCVALENVQQECVEVLQLRLNAPAMCVVQSTLHCRQYVL